MVNVKLKLRYLRHPYLLWRAIVGYFEWKLNKCNRINEYNKYKYTFFSALQNAFHIDMKLLRRYIDQLSSKTDFCRRLNEARNLLRGSSLDAGMPDDDLYLLYVLCRLLRPRRVVETGCGNGFSSATILQALEDNGIGNLYSVDLHFRDGVVTPVGKELGWVIPVHLKRRWHLILGESFKVLPKLLAQLGTIDMFLHDSRHTYRTMMKEFAIVWPYLRKGGLLLSHDVEANDAFLDFSDKVRRTPIIVGNIGILVK